jgi:hypothetical protein
VRAPRRQAADAGVHVRPHGRRRPALRVPAADVGRGLAPGVLPPHDFHDLDALRALGLARAGRGHHGRRRPRSRVRRRQFVGGGARPPAARRRPRGRGRRVVHDLRGESAGGAGRRRGRPGRGFGGARRLAIRVPSPASLFSRAPDRGPFRARFL